MSTLTFPLIHSSTAQLLPQPNVSQQINQYPTQLQQLIRQLQATTQLTPIQTQRAVERANLTAADLMPWASFDHSVSDSYGRKLVFYGGHFEIMVMSWLPGDFSAIHDHGATQWGAVQCFGTAKHFVYQLTEDRLSRPESVPYTPGMVRAVNHDLIHQMGNQSTRPFLSLHVYGCASASNSITGNARVFDLFENSIQHTDGGVFFNLLEDQINHRRYGLSAALETVLIHHCLMRDRIQRMLLNQTKGGQLEPWRVKRLQQKLTALQSAICTIKSSSPTHLKIANCFL